MIPELNILLAEDNDLNAEIAIELLKTKRASVHRAEYGKRAVELFVRRTLLRHSSKKNSRAILSTSSSSTATRFVLAGSMSRKGERVLAIFSLSFSGS